MFVENSVIFGGGATHTAVTEHTTGANIPFYWNCFSFLKGMKGFQSFCKPIMLQFLEKKMILYNYSIEYNMKSVIIGKIVLFNVTTFQNCSWIDELRNSMQRFAVTSSIGNGNSKYAKSSCNFSYSWIR